SWAEEELVHCDGDPVDCHLGLCRAVGDRPAPALGGDSRFAGTLGIRHRPLRAAQPSAKDALIQPTCGGWRRGDTAKGCSNKLSMVDRRAAFLIAAATRRRFPASPQAAQPG